MLQPQGRRTLALAKLLRAADEADQHRRRSGTAHPEHGTGSLMSAAGVLRTQPEPQLGDRDYLDCLILVLGALRKRL